MIININLFKNTFIYTFFLLVSKVSPLEHVLSYKPDYQSESTLYSLPECQGTPWSKQAPYLKFN